jgi:hypothetical protein
MKQPTNFFRYTITNVLGIVQAKPLGENDFRIEWNLQDEAKLFYKKSLPSKIVFKEAMFQNLYSIEKTVGRCDYHTIEVERDCGGVWSSWFSGRFSLNDASWNLYRCEVEIKLDEFEPGQCLEDNKNEEINLFQFIPVRQITALYDPNITIETVTYTERTNGPCTAAQSHSPLWQGAGTPAAGGWVSYYNYWEQEQHFSAYVCFRESRWARQVLILPVADPSPGPQWILDSTGGGNNTWVAPAILTDCTFTAIQPTDIITGGGETDCKILGMGTGPTSLDNGMSLKDILEAFANHFCPGMTVKSEFFQINPDVVTAVNYVTGAASKVRNIRVYQKSDVKRPTVSGNATIAATSFEKFMDYLLKMFNVRYRVVGTVLRVEHISYYSKTAGFDLTAAQYAKRVEGLQKYSYKTESIPAREEFKFMEADNDDFKGLPIIYSGGCVSQEGRKNVITQAADQVTTDVEMCLRNPDPKSSVVDDRGFVFVAVNDAGVILTEPGILAAAALNNPLAWAQLHRDYHRHYRYLKSGEMNGVVTTFLSVRPTKKGATLTVPLCCGDVFDPDNYVTTFLGQGTVEKASYSFKSNMLALDLVYPSDAGLYVPAIAANDVFAVGAGVMTPLDVIANDTPSPSGPITIIEIVIPPMHGTATIGAGPVINYTPALGYSGPDNIAYRVKDGAGFPSNNALVSIVVS